MYKTSKIFEENMFSLKTHNIFMKNIFCRDFTFTVCNPNMKHILKLKTKGVTLKLYLHANLSCSIFNVV